MERSEDEPYHITIQVMNRHCKGLRMLKESQVQDCRLVDIRGTPQGSTRHLVSVSSAELHKLPKDVFADDPSKRTGRETSFWFDTQGCEICRAILSQGSFLISGRNVEGYTCVYSFITPSAHTFQKIVSTLESVGLKIQILDARKFSPKGEILTERQERTLWLALRMGFFEFPRKLTMQELANRLGIALSTVSEIIRRGTRRLLEKHFET